MGVADDDRRIAEGRADAAVSRALTADSDRRVAEARADAERARADVLDQGATAQRSRADTLQQQLEDRTLRQCLRRNVPARTASQVA